MRCFLYLYIPVVVVVTVAEELVVVVQLPAQVHPEDAASTVVVQQSRLLLLQLLASSLRGQQVSLLLLLLLPELLQLPQLLQVLGSLAAGTRDLDAVGVVQLHQLLGAAVGVLLLQGRRHCKVLHLQQAAGGRRHRRRGHRAPGGRGGGPRVGNDGGTVVPAGLGLGDPLVGPDAIESNQRGILLTF